MILNARDMSLYARAYDDGIEALMKRGGVKYHYEGKVTKEEGGKKVEKKTQIDVDLTTGEVAAIGGACAAAALIAFACWKGVSGGSIISKVAAALHVKPSDIGEGVLKVAGMKKRSLLLEDGTVPTELNTRALDLYLEERSVPEIDMDILNARGIDVAILSARGFYDDDEFDLY